MPETTTKAPAGARYCNLPDCDARLSSTNPGKYCRSHPAEKIEKHERDLRDAHKYRADPRPCPHMDPSHLIGLVCEVWGNLSPEAILRPLKGRGGDAGPKRMAVFVCRIDRGLKPGEVAEIFQFANSSNVADAVAVATRDIITNHAFAEKLERVRQRYEEAPA